MIRQDYIMRLIEQLGSVLVKLLRLKESGEYQEALQTINRTYQQFFGLSADLIGSVPDDYLLDTLKTGEVLDGDKCIIIALLLKEEGDVYEALKNHDESYHRYLKSLRLFLEVVISNAPMSLPEHLAQVETVIHNLEPYDLPPAVKTRLWQYYEKTGNYAKAEDVLFRLLDAQPRGKISQEGIAFYKRLLAKSDAELQAGGLPRDEVEEGLQELRKIRH
jgi:tetratricopeptide (TPR) repeat protein